MKFELLDKWMSAAKDWHLPISVFMFIVGSAMQWFHHLDMAYVAYAGTILGAITGHAFSGAAKDKPGDTQGSRMQKPTCFTSSSIGYSGSGWSVALSSGTVPRSISWTIYD